jgi:hypothetical protein
VVESVQFVRVEELAAGGVEDEGVVLPAVPQALATRTYSCARW